MYVEPFGKVMSFDNDYNCGTPLKNAAFRDSLLNTLRMPSRCLLRMFNFRNQPIVFAGKFGRWS